MGLALEIRQIIREEVKKILKEESGFFSKRTGNMKIEVAREKYNKIWRLLKSGEGHIQINKEPNETAFLTMKIKNSYKREVERILSEK